MRKPDEGNIAWSTEVGVRPYRVIAEERLDRKGIVYLRWREAGNWATLSTKETVRNSEGGVSNRKVKAFEKRARDVSERLAQGRTIVETWSAPLTILEGLRRAIDPDKGLYPVDTPHRREVIRELERAATIWGEARQWNTIRQSDLRELYRRRARALAKQGHTGRRGAEITVTRVLAVAEWLRGEGLISPEACIAAKHWKAVLGSEIPNSAPKRPRHTREELLKILDAGPKIDPRLALIHEIGLGMRPGQVVRTKRSAIDLVAGVVRISGMGKKKGALVVMAPEERAALEAALTTGYLAPLEDLLRAGEVTDYHLFPQGQLAGGRKDPATARCRSEQAGADHIDMSAVRGWFKRAETLAGVKSIPGRGPYGIRRQVVDAGKAEGISREGLKELGGWSDTQTPDMIYADADAREGAAEAARIRSKIRGNQELVTPKA